MDRLVVLIRWLIGTIVGGLEAVRRTVAEEPVRTFCGPDRRGFQPPDTPRAGWMKVRRLLKEYGGPPGWWYPFALPAVCAPGQRKRPHPVQPDRVGEGFGPAPYSLTGSSKPTHPAWG